MAARNSTNGPNSPTVNGTEQQQMDLFQNLEKLIASAVSICRLDGSVQCQIGGLITVIEELQRLLRHSFSEIKRLERNLEDQKHTFTNNITNLHYQVKEVQSSVENLKCQAEEAQLARESSSSIQQNQLEEPADDPPQISLGSGGNYSDSIESDGDLVPNNIADNTVATDYSFEGSSQEESSRPSDVDPDSNVKDKGESEVLNEGIAPPQPEPSTLTSDGYEQPAEPQPEPLPETATSTSEERESALRNLRSASSNSDEEKPRRNGRLKSAPLSSKKTGLGKSPLVSDNPPKSPKTTSTKPNVSPRGRPTKESLSKQVLNKNALKNKAYSPRQGKMQQRQTTPQQSRKNTASTSKVKRSKSPAKTPISASKRKKELLTKLQKKGRASGKISQKNLGFKNNANLLVAPPKRGRPLKWENDEQISSGHSLSSSKLNRGDVLVESETSKTTANARGNKEPVATKESSAPSVENPMDKYINLDFLLNANQLMSDLVTDCDREEGSLDTASELERRHIVELAKLYRLRVRMAGKTGKGDLLVALIKGRESSLPKPGQVDRLLNSMTHAMAIKQQTAHTKFTRKHKLAKTAGRQDTAGPTKKKKD